MIEQELISDICRSLHLDDKNMQTVFINCKLFGFARIQEVCQLTSMGVPVLPILSGVLKITQIDVRNRVVNGEVSYEDMLCVLGIFAQELALKR